MIARVAAEELKFHKAPDYVSFMFHISLGRKLNPEVSATFALYVNGWPRSLRRQNGR